MNREFSDSEFYQYSLGIYRQIERWISLDWVHYNQCIRAAASVAANIAEGQGRKAQDCTDYKRFLRMARGSLYEVVAWIDIADIDSKIDIVTKQELRLALDGLNAGITQKIDGDSLIVSIPSEMF